MKLPWSENDEEKIEELEEKIKELEEEKERLESQYEAEKERRSELSRKKQEAEEDLNRLEDKLEGLKGEKKSEKEDEDEGLEDVGFDTGYRLLKKLSTIEDEREELVTVQCPGKFAGFDRRKDLKNSLGKKEFQQLSGYRSFAGFFDGDLGNWLLETRPFFDEELDISGRFDVSDLVEFVEREKIWVLLSAGDTKIFREEGGTVEEVETLKSRIEKQHSKGGFSQGRFERKRDEQIEQHLGEVKEFLEGLEGDVYLLGDQRFCEKVPGKRLGGFDPNRRRPEQFYSFRLKRF